jgi:hypothetical protein
MTEKTARESKFKSHIPEETREHYRNAREEMRKGLETLLPAGFIKHHRAARKEMLLAWRSMLDSAIESMDDKKV